MALISILGGGESGVGAALLAKSKGFAVFLSDAGALKENYQQTLRDNEIEFETGGHSLERILGSQEIIISPGIPEKTDIVKAIKAKGISLVSEIEFAARYTKAKIVAITGSNGKTTTTLLTYHFLQSAGLKVGLAGNIGQSFAKQVMEDQHDVYVLEISSFQLDRCFQFKPDVAVLLNITPDHLDRYEYKFENYIASKFRIFQNADTSTSCVFWADDEVIQSNLAKIPASATFKTVSFQQKAHAYITAEKIQFDGAELLLADAPLKGPHNAINMAVAIVAAHEAGVAYTQILQSLPLFENAPHRLEPCGVWNGVEFINDSKATNVDAVFYALNSYKQPLILMMGGVDKGNEYEVLDPLVKEKVKGLICLGTDNTKLEQHFGPIVPQLFATDSLEDAVLKAKEWAVDGDVVLLSPACASFDLFKNYEDRGDQFKNTVKRLIHG
ncbi:UDP-N-acetylmuramoyl-L-alanine--D-glutamate ligase [Aquirufa antheringensis]|uniref:UDP-N-acetylmuramoylalanine--D-glutamate ligase n=1 Tax=Aquirufa antheringensis TaxID=2516559 RepID=A0A4Q9BGQ5_9BACT|nr:UDP-N-acetylmuramoyl-L-alanine--D-glutamate ligase [Aquirufa antheringensis]MCZ2484396.1 UDP-N-acetylmuramoyl-L-alanine--D-glutamate ligase [Aquirufa antheringensis]TBH74398.1 UDP-N-acetylmuramoyl-L-alanine--D-glutamate ligase [Aquirufa antheringensis]